MNTTTNQEDTMRKSTFNRDLIEGLWKCRHKYPETRPWLRQCIRHEKSRKG